MSQWLAPRRVYIDLGANFTRGQMLSATITPPRPWRHEGSSRFEPAAPNVICTPPRPQVCDNFTPIDGYNTFCYDGDTFTR